MYFLPSLAYFVLTIFHHRQSCQTSCSHPLATSGIQSVLKKHCQPKGAWSEEGATFSLSLGSSSYSARGMLQGEKERTPRSQRIQSQCSTEGQLIEPNQCGSHKSGCLSNAFLPITLQHFLIIQWQEFPMKYCLQNCSPQKTHKPGIFFSSCFNNPQILEQNSESN